MYLSHKEKKKKKKKEERMTKNRKRFRFCAYPFSPFTVASIRETDARWKKQWGHDERRTLTGCGYCLDGGNPVIGHFRNPRGASRKKKEREKKYQCDIFDIYIYTCVYTIWLRSSF